MQEATVIFPHQLFEDHPALAKGRKVYLIEEYLFFKQYRFHKQKLAFHRATMKSYQSWLEGQGHAVEYVECHQAEGDVRKWVNQFEADALHFVDPVDNYLARRLKKGCTMKGIEVRQYDSPSFINTRDSLSTFFKPSKKKFFQTEFYISQRKSLGILLEDGDNPRGGKWTYDVENRKRYPAKGTPPAIAFPAKNPFHDEALVYVEKHFPDHPGNLQSTPLYPIDFQSSSAWLDQFLQVRFHGFGDYEDAIVADQNILHHSVLSPLLNSGLLTPAFVVDRILRYAEEHQVPLNNTEGIIRQIIGWREFIRGVYEVKGSEERTRNFWGFERKIPQSFYDGTTGIAPIDITIRKLLATGYNHHIERLMVLGNFMVLCEFDPDEVYRWFMEMYIDAYDWVMVPNVYGMSQFADGGLMSTKPYISGSNYLMKMSNYKKGAWQTTWDGLFWRFMHVHREFFLRNPRLSMLVRTYDKMSEEKRNGHLQAAQDFLSTL